MAPTASSTASTAPTKTPTKRGRYSTMIIEKKAAIIREVESGRSQAEVAREFKISKQTVSDYIRNKTKIKKAAEKSTGSRQKNVSKGSHPKLEEALHTWLNATVAKRVPVSALGMLSDAWKAVTPDTLRNCFRHAGFTLDSESAVETEDPVPDAQSISTENLIGDLRDDGHAVPPAVTFDKFTDMDSALDVCADLTDEEIVRQVLEPDSESDSEDDAPAIVRPSNAELT
ncbi:hypothetical protein HPB47_007574 [Ixodes persulcatus]|uniref:Uncharacterized protein n=1 Tax=Ixodes persulcatus TaxID=34615 RepID=A0AC60P707_IXOPE|nr:hypothetical protein HPB47_007574 [Ixodes persulcatus]